MPLGSSAQKSRTRDRVSRIGSPTLSPKTENTAADGRNLVRRAALEHSKGDTRAGAPRIGGAAFGRVPDDPGTVHMAEYFQGLGLVACDGARRNPPLQVHRPGGAPGAEGRRGLHPALPLVGDVGRSPSIRTRTSSPCPATRLQARWTTWNGSRTNSLLTY